MWPHGNCAAGRCVIGPGRVHAAVAMYCRLRPDDREIALTGTIRVTEDGQQDRFNSTASSFRIEKLNTSASFY
jgi:hypothetical protein